MKNKTFHLLLVDDDPNMQRMVALFLKKNKYELDIAANGRIALNNLDRKTYDLIISDMQMPLMNGCQLLGKIREQGIKTPVILISAYNSKEMPDDISTDKFNAVLIKPFDSDELLSTIDKILKRKKYRKL
jgi:DNA-binding response OmpR family regulator